MPVYIQEKIHPQALIEELRLRAERGKRGPREVDLFADFNGLDDFSQKVDFYHHDQHWTNRLILGDSLLVMTSLAAISPPARGDVPGGGTSWSSLRRKEKPMQFQVGRASQGPVSKDRPCPGAVRGPEARGWPGEYTWFIEVDSLEALVALLHANGGALGLFAPEGDEEHPVIEIFDEGEGEE